MTSTKYIGLDVHKESISIAVLNFTQSKSNHVDTTSSAARSILATRLGRR
jgi:hypothetical protein